MMFTASRSVPRTTGVHLLTTDEEDLFDSPAVSVLGMPGLRVLMDEAAEVREVTPRQVSFSGPCWTL